MENIIGKTGDYPKGKLNENDEGGLRMAVFTSDGNLIIEFGTSVTWLGMSKAEAIKLAELIIKQANEL